MTLETLFTKRELDIIAHLIQGKSNKQIGVELSISQRTVEYHITNILSKLNVSSRTEAVIKLSDMTLRETAGKSEEILRKSTVDVPTASSDNYANPIAKRRMAMKKYFIIFSAVALVALIYTAINSLKNSSAFIPSGAPSQVAVIQASDTASLAGNTIHSTPSRTSLITTIMVAETVASPTVTATSELIPTPTTTWAPSVVSPVFPDQNIYLRPLPLQFGAWPATAGCPNPEGLEDYAGLLPEVVTDVLQHMAIGTHEAELQWTDPAYWPVLINPFKGKSITQEWINKIAPVSKSTYAQLVTAQCGKDTMKLSWWVRVCPGPCQASGASQALMTNIFMIARMQWLIWAIQ